MNNLKCLRESLKITQESFAEQLGVTQQAIAKWETGEAMPRADKLPEIAKILNCSIEDLFGEV